MWRCRQISKHVKGQLWICPSTETKWNLDSCQKPPKLFVIFLFRNFTCINDSCQKLTCSYHIISSSLFHSFSHMHLIYLYLTQNVLLNSLAMNVILFKPVLRHLQRSTRTKDWQLKVQLGYYKLWTYQDAFFLQNMFTIVGWLNTCTRIKEHITKDIIVSRPTSIQTNTISKGTNSYQCEGKLIYI